MGNELGRWWQYGRVAGRPVYNWHSQTSAPYSDNHAVSLNADPSIGANAAPASIIPSPGAPGVPANVGVMFYTSEDYKVAAGHVHYADALAEDFGPNSGLYGRIMVEDDNPDAIVTNDGTIWNQITGATADGNQNVALFSFANVVNAGEIVLQLDHGLGYGVWLTKVLPFHTGDTLDNTGQIFALVDQGSAFGVMDESTYQPLVNGGIIAAQCGVYAEGVDLPEGGEVDNLAGGEILAEGQTAIAIGFGRGGYRGQVDPEINNAGLIQAVSTDPDRASIGIYAAHLSIEPMQIVNSGTISADYAIYSDAYAFDPAQQATETVTNLAGGRIEGVIFLSLGDDQVINQGTIVGVVDMGEGNDHVDNTGGTIFGYTDLGFGNDSYVGSATADNVLGNRGDDVIGGGDGDDLLLGGFGNDTLTGGNGSDGLYGEYGDDTIIAGAGDFVSAGDGNDKIVLTDLGTYAKIDGGMGFDTLVLPDDPRILDMQSALAAGMLTGIDDVAMGKGLGLVLRPADVAALSDAGNVTIQGNATNTVYLVAGWSEGAQTVENGVTYRVFTAGGDEVLVQLGTQVTLADSAPAGAEGFDATSSTPVPSPNPAFLASTDTDAIDYDLTSSLTIFAPETWHSDNGETVLYDADMTIALTNYGTIESETTGAPIVHAENLTFFVLSLDDYDLLDMHQFAGAEAIGFDNSGTVTNYGDIKATSVGAGHALAFGTGGFGPLVNSGTIEAYAQDGAAGAVFTAEAGYNFKIPAVLNNGTILAHSDSLLADAVMLYNGGYFVNNGLIEATGGAQAIGIITEDTASMINTGTIEASTGAGGQPSVGILYFANSETSVKNSGTISADIAFEQSAANLDDQGGFLTVTNSGSIHGEMIFAEWRDVLVNTGTIVGTVMMGAGNDKYYDTGGHQSGGVVFGGDGNDTLIGGTDDDILDGGAGDDHISGGAGHDTASYADASGAVTVSLVGSSAQNVGGGAGTDKLVSIENLAGSNFNDTLTGNGGANVLSGGAGDDLLNLTNGGNDTALGGDGNDTIAFAASFTVNDRIDGGAGNDTVTLNGDYSAGITLASAGLFGVETLLFGAGHSYNFTSNDANVAAGATLTVNGSKLGATDSLVFNGSHEKDGTFVLTGGAGNDTLTGGAGNDVITGGKGADLLAGGAGSDHFVYVHAAESTGAAFDTISRFDGSQDAFDLTYTVSGINAAVTSGALSAATFDSDLSTAIGASQLSAHHAVLFTASSGDFAGDTFLIVDANNAAGYQAGLDFVIRLDQAAHLTNLAVGSFI